MLPGESSLGRSWGSIVIRNSEIADKFDKLFRSISRTPDTGALGTRMHCGVSISLPAKWLINMRSRIPGRRVEKFTTPRGFRKSQDATEDVGADHLIPLRKSGILRPMCAFIVSVLRGAKKAQRAR